MAAAPPASSIRVFEHSPMTGLTKAGLGATVVATRTGNVTADSVVLATSAALARLPQLRRKLLVLGSDVVASVPIPARLKECGWVPGLAVSDSRRLVHYYRTTNDGRVIFGKGAGGSASPAGWSPVSPDHRVSGVRGFGGGRWS